MHLKLITNEKYRDMYKNLQEREVVWKAICKFIQHDIPQNAHVLDLGCGYCCFINNIDAQKKIAMDIDSEFKRFAAKDVQFIVGPCTNLSAVESNTIDVVFASNLLEHLSREDITTVLVEILRVLKKNGRFIVLQPNFYYCYREYFHDCTHQTIFTHIGLCDLLRAHFEVCKVIPRLLPFSMQTKYSGRLFPKLLMNKYLIYFYLIQPLKFFAKQMYIVSKKL